MTALEQIQATTTPAAQSNDPRQLARPLTVADLVLIADALANSGGGISFTDLAVDGSLATLDLTSVSTYTDINVVPTEDMTLDNVTIPTEGVYYTIRSKDFSLRFVKGSGNIITAGGNDVVLDAWTSPPMVLIDNCRIIKLDGFIIVDNVNKDA